ncbi:MAG: DUF4349 domain-containing protein [Candidatus Woesearchaeota archaeon]
MGNKIKWAIITMLIFIVVFAVGCTKVALEDEQTKQSLVYSTGVAGNAAPMMAEMAVDYAIEDSAYDRSMPSYKGYYPDYDEHYGSGEDIEIETKIIKTAQVTLEVKDYFLSSQKVEAYAKKYDGYVSNSNSNSDYINKYSGTITLRVPAMYFDAVMAELSLLGEIKSKSTGGDDVTEQYIDLQSRINNSKAHEERLVAMYDETKNVNEMMNVERELSRVRGEIEQMQGQLRYMDSKTEMSTVTVYLYEPKPVVKQWGIWTALKNALNNSLATLRWMIELIGWLLPLIISGAIIGLIVKLIRRKSARMKRR